VDFLPDAMIAAHQERLWPRLISVIVTQKIFHLRVALRSHLGRALELR
jgi:hypothetical protein